MACKHYSALLSKIIVFQMQIILVHLLTQAYIFMIKRIPTGLNIFTSKNKRCVVSLPVLCICPLLFKGHPATTIIHHEGQSYCLGYSRERKKSISSSNFDEKLPDLQSHVSPLSTQLMVLLSSVPGGVGSLYSKVSATNCRFVGSV